MDVRGFSNFARQQLADVQVAKYLQALLRLFDEYVASRLQDFSRPTGVTVGCVPDFMPPLRSAIQTVGPDLFLLKELDASSLKGVLGESTLTVYTYAPAVASAHVIADLEERKTVRVVQHAQLSEMLTSGNEIQQRGAIGVICANRLQSFVEDLKRLATDAGLPMTLRDSALAAYYILVGPAGIPLIQRILQDAAKSKEWDLVIASLLASSRFKTSGVTASIIALLKENVPMKVEVHAMNTLKLLGSPDAKEVLCSRLESPNWGIQQQAAEALAEIPFDGKVELLGEALLDQKTHARLRATLAELLGDITTDESLNCLLKAFPLVDGMAQTAVVVALSKLKDPRASSELAKLAESK